jgi:hypothetical protein
MRSRQRNNGQYCLTYPSIDLALVTPHDGLDVRRHDALQRGLVIDRAHPARQLRVPDGGVATDELVVGRRPIDEVVGLGEGE